jgi:hypothetical protein
MFSWWNSLETVSNVSTVSNLLIALLGIWVFVIGKRENHLEAKETEKANAARDSLIATNQLRTEQTILETAKANQLAAEANAHAESLRQTNLVLQNRILEAENKIKPRRITLDQATKFKEVLAPFTKGPIPIVTFQTADAETGDFAQQIAQLLSEAGFQASLVTMTVSGIQIPKGVVMGMRSDEEQPLYAGPMLYAFQLIGIKAAAVRNHSVPSGQMEIWVGGKE